MPSIDQAASNLLLGNLQHGGARLPRPARTPTYLNGKLAYGEGAFTVDCAIRDLSDGGAKIILTKRQALPLDLYLVIIKNCVAYKARVAWLNFPARGLAFCQVYALSGTLPEELKFLRRLWGELYARSGWERLSL